MTFHRRFITNETARFLDTFHGNAPLTVFVRDRLSHRNHAWPILYLKMLSAVIVGVSLRRF